MATTRTEGTEHKRSAVRRRVTYWAVGTYLGLSSLTVAWLLWEKKYDMAIAVLGAVGSMAGSITGFWFGARRPSALSGDEGLGACAVEDSWKKMSCFQPIFARESALK